MHNQVAYDFGEEYRSFTQVSDYKLSYAEFDERLMRGINLFVLPKNEMFYSLERSLDRIIRALPSFKRIFSKPITRLTDTDNILPVEAVRVINQYSMAHISRHSEHWGQIEDGELKPRKLMTLVREEDYVLYENIAFVRLIDMILSYTRKNLQYLRDVMYAHRDMYFNLLESTNHINYFLALGKLHIGYMHAQEQDVEICNRCIEKLNLIDRTLKDKLNSNIYRSCKKNHKKIKLKRTNIFRLHKDYQQVYSLLKWFCDKQENDEIGHLQNDIPNGYDNYCAMLSVFAAGHFNFKFDTAQMDFSNLCARASMGAWMLDMEKISENGMFGMSLTFNKDVPYKICLVFGDEDSYEQEQLADFCNRIGADEYLFATPYSAGVKASIYLSLFDVESFRRIQQIILRGMVESDRRKDMCPFCGNELHARSKASHECAKCHTVISHKDCPNTAEQYWETSLRDYNLIRKRTERKFVKDKLLTEKYAESRLFYRNITPLNLGGDLVCPRCNKIHSEL